MTNIKRAIFIAAGTGTRMQPVTNEMPKPLIPVNGKRIIDSAIEALRSNGIEEIYIIVGYMKEAFEKAYETDEHIHLIENPHYLEGNNITSLYAAREFLPESFVLEADILVQDPSIFSPEIEKSGYMATWMDPAPEWLIGVENNRIVSCDIEGCRPSYRLWGISMWDKEQGEKLAEEIRHLYEDEHKWDIYWDQVALMLSKDQYDLGIREIPENALCEIDTVAELSAMDPSYEKYLAEVSNK